MRLTRRGALLGTGGVAATGLLGVATLEAAPWRMRRALGLTPDPYIPDAEEGVVELTTVSSRALGADVDLFTAVPAGHGDGAGLPVVVVMHGASASAAEFRGFGFGRFVTAAVAAGAPPFVLAGTDDGPYGWVPGAGVDPFTMLRDELPGWLGERRFDVSRRAVWAWSRGGYGALRLALDTPQWARSWALFSPAVADDDPALTDLSRLAGARTALWCGTGDQFYDDVCAVADRLPTPPEVQTYTDGGHTRVFWNDHTVEALTWLAGSL
ncbi:alpha/beta hydrolase-fold protein [Nocardioides sp. YIM 152588]|uniref:alpha/beta hydrolase n=1 Tax=Nocardioides sp. YIM 152588 TaxID=3158259 RepID=UPI0032E4D4FF